MDGHSSRALSCPKAARHGPARWSTSQFGIVTCSLRTAAFGRIRDLHASCRWSMNDPASAQWPAEKSTLACRSSRSMFGTFCAIVALAPFSRLHHHRHYHILSRARLRRLHLREIRDCCCTCWRRPPAWRIPSGHVRMIEALRSSIQPAISRGASRKPPTPRNRRSESPRATPIQPRFISRPLQRLTFRMSCSHEASSSSPELVARNHPCRPPATPKRARRQISQALPTPRPPHRRAHVPRSRRSYQAATH